MGLLAAALLLSALGSARLAHAQTVTPGFVSHFEDLGGVRYRSFGNTGGQEVFLGVPDLGTAANRVGADVVWSKPTSHQFTFQYDQANDKLTTTIVNPTTLATVTLNYPGFAAAAAAKSKMATVCDLDIMQITVANRDTGTTVKLENVFLDGHALGTFDGGTTPLMPPLMPVLLDWMVTNYDFGHGFTLTGDLTLDGPFGGSQELSRVEIKVGRSSATGMGCNDNSPCSTDSCNVTSGCQHVAANGGAECRASSGVCDPAEVCDGMNHACPPDAKSPDNTGCNDGDACTQTDTCQMGACTGSNPVVCVASDQCHIAGTCNTGNGLCSNPAKTDGTACNDSDACTQTDTCQTGACTGSNPVACVASDQCHIAGTCNPLNGNCSNPNKPDGSACNDGDMCTQTDACTGGVCSGNAVGADTDNDGYCDAQETMVGCNPNDGAEIPPQSNTYSGGRVPRGGEVLMTFRVPGARTITAGSDPACAAVGVCTSGFCAAGKIGDHCMVSSDCNQTNACRVVINYAETPDLELLSAQLRVSRTPPADLMSLFTPATPGCSRKVDISLPGGFRNAFLKLKAQGTTDGRLRRDRDRVRYKP